jgi:hypothetical protein
MQKCDLFLLIVKLTPCLQDIRFFTYPSNFQSIIDQIFKVIGAKNHVRLFTNPAFAKALFRNLNARSPPRIKKFYIKKQVLRKFA